MRETHKKPSKRYMSTNETVEKKSFYEEYKAAREKARSQGYASLTKYEVLVLEKGDDYLLG